MESNQPDADATTGTILGPLEVRQLRPLQGISPRLKGAFNDNQVLVAPDGVSYLERTPIRPDRELLTAIGLSLDRIHPQLSVRVRPPLEQAIVQTRLAAAGLRVLVPSLATPDVLYTRYLADAVTLDQFLARGEPAAVDKVLPALFADLRAAHRAGVTYGDRWTRNVLVDPGQPAGFVNIDFDLEIVGPGAAELDVAQLAYFCLVAGKEKALVPLAAILGARDWFDPDLVERILRLHAGYFKKGPLGGVDGHLARLLELVARFQEQGHGRDGASAFLLGSPGGKGPAGLEALASCREREVVRQRLQDLLTHCRS